MKKILKSKKLIVLSSLSFFIVAAIIVKLTIFVKDADRLIAFGDSTVYGDISNQTSYIDYLANDLIQTKVIKEYSKSFARSSLKSNDLLSMIENNAYTIKGNSTITIEDEVKKAKIITISIGMADVLANFQYIASKEIFEYDEVVVNRTIDIVQNNVYEIIKLFQNISPTKNIYLVGCYFPFPTLSNDEIEREIPIFKNLNTALSTAANDRNIRFINTEEVSDSKYLPNIPTYLLNDEGNKAMANIVKQQLIIL